MFVAGVVLCVSLILTDLGIGFTEPRLLTQFNGEWLRSHSYIPNILAGLTGFLVGVPVALVVLQTVIGKREDNVELAKAKRVSAAAWGDFRSAATEFASPTRRNALLSTALNEVYPLYEDIYRHLQEYRGQKPFVPPTQDQHDKLIAYLKSKEAEFKREIDSVTTKVGNIDELLKLWSRVLSTWSVVNVYVRSRRIELDLHWFNDDSNSTLVSALATTASPLADFTHVHNGFGIRPPASMDMAHQWVLSYIRWEKDKLDRALQSDDKVLGVEGVEDYQKHTQQAALFLNGLHQAVKQIDEEGWPDQSASTPQPS